MIENIYYSFCENCIRFCLHDLLFMIGKKEHLNLLVLSFYSDVYKNFMFLFHFIGEIAELSRPGFSIKT